MYFLSHKRQCIVDVRLNKQSLLIVLVMYNFDIIMQICNTLCNVHSTILHKYMSMLCYKWWGSVCPLDQINVHCIVRLWDKQPLRTCIDLGDMYLHSFDLVPETLDIHCFFRIYGILAKKLSSLCWCFEFLPTSWCTVVGVHIFFPGTQTGVTPGLTVDIYPNPKNTPSYIVWNSRNAMVLYIVGVAVAWRERSRHCW